MQLQTHFHTSALVAALVASPVASAARVASNDVVVMIDNTGSFRSKQQAASDAVVALLDKLAAQKVHRWDTVLDRVAIIAIDASPAVVWEGSLRDLKEKGTRDLWLKNLKARSDYSACTDQARAFQLAADRFLEDAPSVSKHLFLYTDLVNEPPMNATALCAHKQYQPPKDFPWEALAGADVQAFWVPKNIALNWTRAIEKHELSKTFKVHTVSESAVVQAEAPKREEATTTPEEAAADREKVLSVASTVGHTALVLFAGLFGMLALLIAGAAFARRRPAPVRPLPRPAPRPLRPAPQGARLPPAPGRPGLH